MSSFKITNTNFMLGLGGLFLTYQQIQLIILF